MLKSKRAVIVLILVVLALALPTTVLANKQLYKARLSGEKQGNATIAYTYGGTSFRFHVRVDGVSDGETISGINIYGSSVNLVTLCGIPTPAVLGACPAPSSGNVTIDGEFTGGYLQSGTGAEFINALNSGLLSINVYEDGGATLVASGQITPQ